MPEPFDWRIIDRHLAGESSPDDDLALARWLADDPGHAQLLDHLRTLAASDDSRARETWNVDAAWSRLSGRMADERPTSHLSLASERAVPATRRTSWRAASAVAVTIVAASLVVVVWRTSITPVAHPAGGAVREVAASRAQQTHVTLSDGTRVVLNAGSRLRYASDFGRTSRDVELEGEGYFEVVHDGAHPFRVRAHGNVAEDLGTRFAVRAYADGSPTQVVVAQGRVSLAREGTAPARGQLLEPGELGRVEPDGRVTVVRDVDVERWVSWARGALVLDGLSLAEAATEIGRRYDVRIVVPDSALARRRVSARFHDASLTTVLDAVSLALGARWSGDGITIVIRTAP